MVCLWHNCCSFDSGVLHSPVKQRSGFELVQSAIKISLPNLFFFGGGGVGVLFSIVSVVSLSAWLFFVFITPFSDCNIYM